MKTFLALFAVVFCVVSLSAADEPKPAPNQNQEAMKEIEAINAKIKELEGRLDALQKGRNEPPQKLTPENAMKNFSIQFRANGFVQIGDLQAQALETGGFNFTSQRTATEMAQRWDAQTVKRHVQEADAKAKAILNSSPPNHTTRQDLVPKPN